MNQISGYDFYQFSNASQQQILKMLDRSLYNLGFDVVRVGTIKTFCDRGLNTNMEIPRHGKMTIDFLYKPNEEKFKQHVREKAINDIKEKMKDYGISKEDI